MIMREDASRGLYAALDGTHSLDAALLMKRTGAILASWIREDESLAALSVMSATMMASIATIVETLGSPSPQMAAVETDERRIFAIRADSQAVLVLMGQKAAGDGYLRQTARRILSKLTAAPEDGRAQREGILSHT